MHRTKETQLLLWAAPNATCVRLDAQQEIELRRIIMQLLLEVAAAERNAARKGNSDEREDLG
jgi:hypothetical protein